MLKRIPSVPLPAHSTRLVGISNIKHLLFSFVRLPPVLQFIYSPSSTRWIWRPLQMQLSAARFVQLHIELGQWPLSVFVGLIDMVLFALLLLILWIIAWKCPRVYEYPACDLYCTNKFWLTCKFHIMVYSIGHCPLCSCVSLHCLLKNEVLQSGVGF